MGGVYNPFNLSLYAYAHLSPSQLLDPDGNEGAGNPYTHPERSHSTIAVGKTLADIEADRNHPMSELGKALIPGSGISDIASEAADGNAGTAVFLGVMETAGKPLKAVGDAGEIFYRAMSKSDFEILNKTGKLPATSETFVSPTREFAENYDGVLVQFNMKGGVSSALAAKGVRDGSKITEQLFPGMPSVFKGWNQSHALFKAERGQVNIGLGKGEGLDTFNQFMQSYKVLRE